MAVRLFVFDVDGTLTDCQLTLSNGQRCVSFNVKDGMALSLLPKIGIPTIAITGRQDRDVDARLRQLGFSEIHMGITDKLSVLKECASERNITLRDVAYMGDDVNDIPCMGAVGFAAAPADCASEVINYADYRTRKKGGEGAAREVITMVMRNLGFDFYDTWLKHSGVSQ